MTEEAGAAMVEFMSAETVSVALGRDGKKLDGRAIHVSMLWRCTLYVTNFPRSADNDSLKQLFGQVSYPWLHTADIQYGNILSIRWPSRKYVDSRRFAYITMESPAAAQEALVLHKFQPAGETFPMSVLISDPSKRTKRTDYSDCTLFIGGLHPKSTEGEVRHLLEKYGTIISVKVPWDKAKNQAKGIAFVEMQNKAQAEAALAANGASHRGKHLKVEISDPQHATKNRGKISNPQQAADRRERTVYLFDIPAGSQEGLLQQELEKHYPVLRVELFANKGSARVELQSAKDAGALLMRSDIKFNGATLRVQDHPESKVAPAKPAAAMAASTSKPEAAASSLSFAPRPRKTHKAMGQAYRPPKAAAATAAAAPTAGSGQDSFRAFMNETNEERKKKNEEAKAKAEAEKAQREAQREADRAKREAEKAEAREADKKRALEDGEDSEAKRPKRDEDGSAA
jgi:RNA recognition motif-containing protein